MTVQPPAASSDHAPPYPYPPDSVRRKQQRGWYFYDFANSTFSTTVITLFLGPYLTDVAQSAANPAGFVQFLGIDIRATSVFAFAAQLGAEALHVHVDGARLNVGGRFPYGFEQVPS